MLCQIWQGGAGDGVAGLVVFGGQTFGRTGQAIYMNDVWLYTPHTGKWREVSQMNDDLNSVYVSHDDL